MVEGLRQGNDQDLKVIWLGDINHEVDWLREKVESTAIRYKQRLSFARHPLCETVAATSPVNVTNDSAVFEELLSADRIVVSWSSRVGYPWRTLTALQSRTMSVPWAVVTSSWIDGSRRTGIGPVNHVQLPWYRWWEGWHGWFFPEHARRGALTQAHFAPTVNSIDWTRPMAVPHLPRTTTLPPVTSLPACNRTQPCLAIVGGCVETLALWQCMAEQAGWSAATFRSIDPLLAGPTGRWDCLLIDDSLVASGSTGHATHDSAVDTIFIDSLSACVTRSHAAWTNCPIVVALGLEHLSSWRTLRSLGVSDLLIKPSFGLPLPEYLHAAAQ